MYQGTKKCHYRTSRRRDNASRLDDCYQVSAFVEIISQSKE
jgi:hypothetical protein